MLLSLILLPSLFVFADLIILFVIKYPITLIIAPDGIEIISIIGNVDEKFEINCDINGNSWLLTNNDIFKGIA